MLKMDLPNWNPPEPYDPPELISLQNVSTSDITIKPNAHSLSYSHLTQLPVVLEAS